MSEAPLSHRDEDFLAEAISLARTNVASGGGPFGAVVVDPAHAMLAWGVNRVTATPDPTAHAEVEAIRAAAHDLGDFSLAGCTLYSSCEPCPMCLGAIFWARLDRVVYAATRTDAARAGFDDGSCHDLFRCREDAAWPMVRTHLAHPAAQGPFEDWLRYAEAVPY
jgi:guanine deaminase